ncbi:MAG: 50S ribosomal protein L24 [Patescibacteria group bacterium]
MHIRTGDTIMMLIGKDKDKTGKILQVLPKSGKAVVESLNLIKRHQRPKKQGQKGEIISRPRPIDISNVMLICRHCKKPARMGLKREGKKIIRVCKKCQGEN